MLQKFLFSGIFTMSEQSHKPDRTKRKRKKSFLKNARKYAKKGCYGRGTQLDADTYQYFVRIMEAYREGFDSEDDKKVFVKNVFEQTVGQELDCCSNQVGCRVVEMLLPFADNEVLQRFMRVFGDELRPLCADRFATHVLEALVRHSAHCFFNRDGSTDADFQTTCKEFVMKVSRFLLNNLEDYLWDTYGSHVIRTCLESLAQIPKDNLQKPVPKDEDSDASYSEEFVEIVKDYGERIMSWPQFNDLCNTETSSGFLQVLLRALKKTNSKTLKLLLDKLISSNFACDDQEVTENSLPAVFLSKPTIMVLETALDVAKRKGFTKIYVKCCHGRLAKLATTRSTNFVVQKLILNCREKSEFEAIFDELISHLKDIIDNNHTGIIWALAQACKSQATKQGSFLQQLSKSLGCPEEDTQTNFILCLCKFKSLEDVNGETSDNLHKEKLNLHGTLTLQLLLEFNKPIKIVNGLLSMEQKVLLGLFSNTMGSHIVDSYVKSTFVGEKSREKLVRKMKGVYQELASSKYGSRSFEALWKAANIKNKLFIIEEMSFKDGSWSNSEFGKIIASKIKLSLFKRNKEEWKNSLNNVNKAKELFGDILK